MATKQNDPLLFIDTNILLDFYRHRNSNLRLDFLGAVEAKQHLLIRSSQIEMEYKKNRQGVILQHLSEFKKNTTASEVPTILSDSKDAEMYKKSHKRTEKIQKKISNKIQNILQNPARFDPVYQALQRIFKKRSNYNLDRESKGRFAIRRLARKRFSLGYPPRKQDDTSIGDAINWEWVVQCAISSGKDIVIVSRDSDYGVLHNKSWYLNDWLLQEFKQRVGQRRNISLTGNLADALKKVDAKVTPEMESAEAEQYGQASATGTATATATATGDIFFESDK